MLRQSFEGGGQTIAGLFDVRTSLANLRPAEAGEADAWEVADRTLEARLAEALGRAGRDAAPETLPASLSGRLRTWAALAAMIFAEPDFLLLEEPSSNLERKGCAAAE